MAATWQGNGAIKYGTWNVRDIARKEMEPTDEMKKAQVMAITETKKEGMGCAGIGDGFTLIHSGVPISTRAINRKFLSKLEVARNQNWQCTAPFFW